MNLIAAVDMNWAIGKQDELLFRIRTDLRRFKELTRDNIVICGRRTVQTFPGGKPLAGRINLILSRQHDLDIEDAIMCRDQDELFAELNRLNFEGYDDSQIYVIGGASIYKLLMPYCSKALITYIHASVEDADCHLPDFGRLTNWIMQDKSEIMSENSIEFEYRTYINPDPETWHI
ncbi:MAG: dihydrofolate reductase [Clostridiaceae bacterium]|nr:dihydrofolate reductase [Clostridiaceae bacterium]